MRSMVTQIYKIGAEIWATSPQKWRPKSIKMRGQTWDSFVCNLMANISGKKQNIVERKTALQTAISLAHAHLIW